jgi:hypothetical protein
MVPAWYQMVPGIKNKRAIEEVNCAQRCCCSLTDPSMALKNTPYAAWGGGATTRIPLDTGLSSLVLVYITHSTVHECSDLFPVQQQRSEQPRFGNRKSPNDSECSFYVPDVGRVPVLLLPCKYLEIFNLFQKIVYYKTLEMESVMIVAPGVVKIPHLRYSSKYLY